MVLGRCNPQTLHPDLDWLEAELAGPSPPKMVVLVNPCNPTGPPWRSLPLLKAWLHLSCISRSWGCVHASCPDSGRSHSMPRTAPLYRFPSCKTPKKYFNMK